jgi:hypothetical protein
MIVSAEADVIGAATSAKNAVSGSLGSVIQTLAVGSQVSGSEVVTTGTDSATLLRFLDDTNLNIGASSTVVLDRFVYNPDGSAANAVINISRGAMRFVTGKSNPNNFAIHTDVATIGIRGTDFVVFCNGHATCIVAVKKGVVKICPHPDTPVDGCRDAYEIDPVNNYTLIGPGGKTKGAQQIAGDIMLRLYGIIADGGKFDVATFAPGYQGPPPPPPSSVSPH